MGPPKNQTNAMPKILSETQTKNKVTVHIVLGAKDAEIGENGKDWVSSRIAVRLKTLQIAPM
jgi:hypothetical protein